MAAWPPAFDKEDYDVSPTAARLFHVRKYHDMVRDQVRALQGAEAERREEEGEDGAGTGSTTLGRHLLSRMLLLEELEETIRQLERLLAQEAAV